MPVAHQLEVLILQHPLEATNPKGSARLLHLCLPGSRLYIGESWRADALHAMLNGPLDALDALNQAAGDVGQAAFFVIGQHQERRTLIARAMLVLALRL